MEYYMGQKIPWWVFILFCIIFPIIFVIQVTGIKVNYDDKDWFNFGICAITAPGILAGFLIMVADKIRSASNATTTPAKVVCLTGMLLLMVLEFSLVILLLGVPGRPETFDRVELVMVGVLIFIVSLGVGLLIKALPDGGIDYEQP